MKKYSAEDNDPWRPTMSQSTPLSYVVSARSDFVDSVETGAPLRWLVCARFRFLVEAIDYKDAAISRGAHVRLHGPFDLAREYCPETTQGVDLGTREAVTA